MSIPSFFESVWYSAHLNYVESNDEELGLLGLRNALVPGNRSVELSFVQVDL